MKRVERAVNALKNDIDGKIILEAACGCGEFSLCAGKSARTVHCIDLEKKRLLPEVAERGNIIFSEMDVRAMTFESDSFDTVVIYNAIGHLAQILSETLDECLRVLRPDGSIYVVSSYGMDKPLIRRLPPLLEGRSCHCELTDDGIFLYARIKKARIQP